MKKILIALMVSVVSVASFAKSSSKVNEEASVASVGACMVQVDDAGATRFINVNYIRSLEIIKDEKYNAYPAESNPRIMIVRMASNYGARSSYPIMYPTEAQAKAAINELAMKINKCGK